MVVSGGDRVVGRVGGDTGFYMGRGSDGWVNGF